MMVGTELFIVHLELLWCKALRNSTSAEPIPKLESSSNEIRGPIINVLAEMGIREHLPTIAYSFHERADSRVVSD